MSSEGESLFNLLSTEILDYIFQFLNLPDKEMARLVCHRWRYILDHPTLRTYYFQPFIKNDADVKTLLNTCLDIDCIQIQNLQNIIPSMTYSRNKFPPIKIGIIEINNSGSNIITFLKYGCGTMKCLIMNESTLGNVNSYQISRVLPEIKWNNLLELELVISWSLEKFKQDMNHIKAMKCFLKFATAPKLKRLNIRLENDIKELEYIVPIHNLMTEFYGFLSRHTATLKILELLLKTEVVQVDLAGFVVSDEIQMSILQNLKLVEFEIWFNQHHTIELLLPCLLDSNLKLSTLTWISGDLNENRLQRLNTDIVERLIQKNENTLECLRIINSMNINLEWIKNCKSLKCLAVSPSGLEMNSNIDICLPSLEYLEIVPRDYLPQEFDIWIIRNFQNIKRIVLRYRVRNLELYEFQNLLTLPRIREIHHWGSKRENNNHDQIRQFCLNTPGLSHRYTRGCFCHVYGADVILDGWIVVKAETNRRLQ